MKRQHPARPTIAHDRRTARSPALLAALVGFFLLCQGRVRADELPLTIADLSAYRDALAGKPSGAPTAVGFRELWARPKQHQGKRVQVEGRVVRVFQQGKVGTFPPLTEL